jgi:general secretion pathway protein D
LAVGRVGYRGAICAALVVVVCLVAGCQSATDKRRLAQFLGGKEPEVAAQATDSASAGPHNQISLAKPVSLAPAAIDQPPSDTAGVPTLSGPELYPGAGLTVQAAAQTNPITLGASGDVTLNFVNADIREVIDTVLGKTLKLSFVIDPRVQGVTTLRTTGPVPKDQVIGVLEDVLAMNGVALVDSGGLYKILPIEDAATAPEILSGAGPVRVERGFGLHVIPLKYASAAALREVVEAFVPPGRVLRIDAARNLVVFVGTSPESKDIEDLIATFDVDWMAGMSFGLFPLQVADPETMATELERIFAQQEGGALSGVVQFVPIKRLSAVLVITPQAAYLNDAKQWIARLDRGQEGDQRKLYVYYVQNGRAAELADVLGQVFGIQTGTAAREERPGLAPGLTPTNLGGGGFGDTGMGNSGLGNTGLGNTGLGNTGLGNTGLGNTPGLSSSTYPPRQGGFGSSGTTGTALGRSQAGTGESATGGGPLAPTEGAAQSGVRIVADSRNNALVVYATPAEYATINAALEKLDIVPLQVMIEATIAEVTLNDTLKYGVEWFFKTGNNSFSFSRLATGVVTSAFPGFSYLFAGDDARVAINLLAQVTDVKVISSPQLMVLDNEAARLQVGDQVPILSRTSQIDNGNVISEIQYRDTGVILDIIPRVNASGLVVLDIVQEVSDVATTTTSDIDSPTIQERQIASTVAINSGETVALGGLIRDTNDNSENGLPVLKDIPVVGNLFKTTSDSVRRTELIVLLTPRVIRDRQDARTATDDLRRRLRALPQLVPKIQ